MSAVWQRLQQGLSGTEANSLLLSLPFITCFTVRSEWMYNLKTRRRMRSSNSEHKVRDWTLPQMLPGATHCSFTVRSACLIWHVVFKACGRGQTWQEVFCPGLLSSRETSCYRTGHSTRGSLRLSDLNSLQQSVCMEIGLKMNIFSLFCTMVSQSVVEGNRNAAHADKSHQITSWSAEWRCDTILKVLD